MRRKESAIQGRWTQQVCIHGLSEFKTSEVVVEWLLYSVSKYFGKASCVRRLLFQAEDARAMAS